jgi:hypothetical protein
VIVFNPDSYRKNKVRGEIFPAKYYKVKNVTAKEELTFSNKSALKIIPAE